MSMSYGVAVWICRTGVPPEKIRETFQSLAPGYAEADATVEIYEREKPAATLAVCALDEFEGLQDDQSSIGKVAQGVAKALGCNTYGIYAFAGSADFVSITAWDAKGKSRWAQESLDDSEAGGERVHPEVARIAQHFRLDPSEAGDENIHIVNLPYWRLVSEVSKRPEQFFTVNVMPVLEVDAGWNEVARDVLGIDDDDDLDDGDEADDDDDAGAEDDVVVGELGPSPEEIAAGRERLTKLLQEVLREVVTARGLTKKLKAKTRVLDDEQTQEALELEGDEELDERVANGDWLAVVSLDGPGEERDPCVVPLTPPKTFDESTKKMLRGLVDALLDAEGFSAPKAPIGKSGPRRN